MGDQVGEAVSGELCYVPFKEFERVLSFSGDRLRKTALFASLCRINALYMIARAGSGHIGSSFSSMDIMCWMQLNEVQNSEEGCFEVQKDLFYSSKGHDAPALYSALIGMGKLKFDLIHQLRQLGGLPGHPDISIPNVVTNTGSLGMGVSKAKGLVIANRVLKRGGKVYILMGDGELQEGQFWESLISAANHKLHEITVIIDHNKLQSDTLVSKVSDLGDLGAKLTAFGWHVERCDGNDLRSFSEALARSKDATDKPKIIIADTIKGRGVSFMEHTSFDSDVELYKFHSGAPADHIYAKASQELVGKANALINGFGKGPLELEIVHRNVPLRQPERQQRLIHAYSDALLVQARKNDKIVALNADLMLDTGLVPFQMEFPDRFVECGIAEQDMVSQAGGMALGGLLPVVHSFACFLSSRPNEQIYNNATEKTKIVYVGSLAGVLPGGPGHSHQGVRDIAALGAMPNIVMVEPSCEKETTLLLDWCINRNDQSSYMRLVSVPVELPFKLPDEYLPQIGCGVALTSGEDVLIVTYGPLMLAASVDAARLMSKAHKITVTVINLPWLNIIDADWFSDSIKNIRHVVSIDNHYRVGGQGDRLADLFSAGRFSKQKFHRIAIEELPVCGSNLDVLRYHQLDASSIVKKLTQVLGI
jgi:transketolase